jgi:FtsZ-binding cell division protein ZapB
MTAKPSEAPREQLRVALNAFIAECGNHFGEVPSHDEQRLHVQFIARCDPTVIAEMFDELTAAQAEIEHLHRDSERYYWSDGHVKKLHTEIAALREKVNSLRSESDGWQETARQFKLSYEAAEARATKAEALLRGIDPLRSEMQRAADQTQKDRQ